MTISLYTLFIYSFFRQTRGLKTLLILKKTVVATEQGQIAQMKAKCKRESEFNTF